MSRGKLAEFLDPQQERDDPEFAREIERLSVVGLRVVAGVCFGVPSLVLLVGGVWLPQFLDGVVYSSLVALLGALSLGASFWTPARAYARLLGVSIGYVVSVLQAFPILSTGSLTSGASHQQFGNVTFVLLVGITAFPSRPVHTLALGTAMVGSYVALAMRLGATEALTGSGLMMVVLMSIVVVMCTGLTAVVYRQRAEAFQARRSAEQAFDDLKQAQARLLVSENGASQGRFAAAISHELNTPLGSLGSALDTLGRALQKIDDAPERQEALRGVVQDSLSSARDSRSRLSATVDRLKHVTNLDRADSVEVDLNELWRDTAELLQPEIAPRAELTLTLAELPRIRCRPQQMSAVFSNLLRNAASAMEAKGAIEVTSSARNGEVVLEVRDDGRGMPPEQVEHLFDPTFRVEGSRVATTNWGLFVSRSIVAEHGGQIQIESEPGRGTTARIVLPARAEL